MPKHGKTYNEVAQLVDRDRAYEPAEAADLLKQTSRVGFDATLEEIGRAHV